jgi:hypothetical protein
MTRCSGVRLVQVLVHYRLQLVVRLVQVWDCGGPGSCGRYDLVWTARKCVGPSHGLAGGRGLAGASMGHNISATSGRTVRSTDMRTRFYPGNGSVFSSADETEVRSWSHWALGHLYTSERVLRCTVHVSKL